MSEVELHRVRAVGRTVLLAEGPAGWGECSPFPGYPCTFEAAFAAAIEAATRPWLAPRRNVLRVNALVEDAAAIDRVRGFETVKVKVGRRDLKSDLCLLAAVRDAVGPRVAIRVDANGAWDEETAVGALDAMHRYDVELAEQPVMGLEGLARVRRRSPLPVAADECVRSVEDAERLRRTCAADAVVIKVQPLGGARAALKVSEAAGCPAVVSSMMETSVGVAVSASLAAALPDHGLAHGLAVLGRSSLDVCTDPLVAEGGMLEVGRAVPDPGALRRMATDLPCHGEEVQWPI